MPVDAEGFPAPMRVKLSRAGAELWAPLLAFALSLAGLFVVAYASGYHPWSAATWARWDSAHYLSIARGGYEIHRCDTGQGWCGNTAWFPGYPLLVAAPSALGLPPLSSALALSWAFALAALVVLWRTFLADHARTAALAGVAYAAWAPGQIYEYAVFPLSVLFFLTVLFLRYLQRGRWLAAGLAGAGAVATYPSAVSLAAVSAGWALLMLRQSRVRAVVLSTGPIPLSLLSVLAVQRLQTGRWTAFFDVQQHYEHGLHDPIGQVWNAVLVVTRERSVDLGWASVTAVQTLIVTAILAAVVVSVLIERRRLRRFDPTSALFALWGIVTWAFPLTLAHVSLWRSQAALAPLAVLVARLPRPLMIGAVVVVVTLSVPIGRLFFDGALI